MTLTTFASFGGWWAAALAALSMFLLLANRPRDTAQDREDRRMMTYLVVMFGWIPVGALGMLLWGWLAG